jgi:hypothetical protein
VELLKREVEILLFMKNTLTKVKKRDLERLSVKARLKMFSLGSAEKESNILKVRKI